MTITVLALKVDCLAPWLTLKSDADGGSFHSPGLKSLRTPLLSGPGDGALLLPRSLPFLKQALPNRADSFALGSPYVPPCPLSLLNGMDNSDYCGNAWIIKVRTPSNRTVASERVDLNGSPAKKALERETGCPHTTCSLSLAVHSMCRELQGEVQGTPRESLCPHQKPERSL